MPPTDSELIDLARRGDSGAFHAIVDRYADGLYATACSMLGSPADAEDVLQETFLGAFRGLDRFEGRASLRTWLSSILMRQVSKAYRSRRVRRHESLDEDRPDAPPARSGSASADADRRADVLQMLQTLSEEFRAVMVLRELEGMSYDEIAEALSIPRGTVESRLFRARQQLKQRFAGYMQE